MKVYQRIAEIVAALPRCGSGEWFNRLEDELLFIEGDYLPSGHGFDEGVFVDRDNSHDEEVCLNFEYHIMNDHGYYDGWVKMKAMVTPSFHGFNIELESDDEVDEYLKDDILDTLQYVLDVKYES